MNLDQVRRPWWRKKRWIATVLFALPVIGLLVIPPVQHAGRRGWLPSEVEYLDAPVMLAATYHPPLGMPYAQYKAWWWGLGELPDYTVTSWDNGFLFAPKDRYYHRNSPPQVRWWLADGL